MLQPRPAKIGTQPHVVVVHGRDRLEVGRWVRIREQLSDGSYPRGWQRVLITGINPDGYFFADR